MLPGVLDQATEVSLPTDTSLAAVLVPILVATPEPRLVFTRRTETLSRHAGEISFPGGLADEGEDPATAALREAEEELGLAPADVELVGSLPHVQEFEHEGRTFQTHVYEVDGHVIWGATARILWSFIELLGGAGGRNGVLRPA